MLLLIADGVFFVMIAPFLVVLAVPAAFFVFRDAKGGASPPPWAAAVTLSAAIWLLAAYAGANLTLFGNYALVPLLIGIPLTFAVALYGDYAFDWQQSAGLFLLGPVGSVLMFWHPTREMPGLDALRNFRPFGAPEPPPRRRKPNDR